MALQAASLVPASFSITKEGKSSVSLRSNTLFGFSLSDTLKADQLFSIDLQEGIPTKSWCCEGPDSGYYSSRSHKSCTRRQENIEERQCCDHWGFIWIRPRPSNC